MPQTALNIAKSLGLSENPPADILTWGNSLANGTVTQIAPLFKVLEPPKEELPPLVRHSADESVLQFGVSYCIVQIHGIHVKKKIAEIEQRKRQIEARIKELGPKWCHSTPEVMAFQNIYKQIGKTHGEILTPVETLSNYIFESNLGRLPQINAVVDLYNLYSLTHFLSIGAHDRTKIRGSIRLEFARNTIRYFPIGHTSHMDILPGEYYWREDVNVLCRLDLKQGDATKIEDSTKHIVLIVIGNTAIKPAVVRQHTESLCREIVQFCGGDYTIIGGPGME
jgi:DNA/RNA-binding domain of Phe-tRNA-synthetase-like protein